MLLLYVYSWNRCITVIKWFPFYLRWWSQFDVVTRVLAIMNGCFYFVGLLKWMHRIQNNKIIVHVIRLYTRICQCAFFSPFNCEAIVVLSHRMHECSMCLQHQNDNHCCKHCTFAECKWIIDSCCCTFIVDTEIFWHTYKRFMEIIHHSKWFNLCVVH